MALTGQWEHVDLFHRKLARRGSQLDVVYVSDSSVFRLLTWARSACPVCPGQHGLSARRDPTGRARSRASSVHDFTSVAGLSGWCAIAVVEVVTKKYLALNLSAEEAGYPSRGRRHRRTPTRPAPQLNRRLNCPHNLTPTRQRRQRLCADPAGRVPPRAQDDLPGHSPLHGRCPHRAALEQSG